jgi:hypothetical protein
VQHFKKTINTSRFRYKRENRFLSKRREMMMKDVLNTKQLKEKKE